MPCTDGGVPYHSNTPEKDLKDRDAMLCMALSWIEKHGLMKRFRREADDDEAGVDMPCLLGWWAAHKEIDERRKKQFQDREKIERQKNAVLSKLTAAERKILGLK